MPSQPLDANGQARAALGAIARDYGSAALSNPEFMNGLLRDMIPDLPREANVLVAAAEANVAGILQERAAQRFSTAAAVAQAMATLEERTALAPDACQWAAYQLAEALGLPQPVGTTQPGPARQPQPAQFPPPGPPPQPGLQSQPGLQPPPGPPPWSMPTHGIDPRVSPAGVAPAPPSAGQSTRAAIVAASAAMLCALSIPLQLLAPGGLTAAYSWIIALIGLTLFGAGVLTLAARSKFMGVGMIFGAALAAVSLFILVIFSTGVGGGFVAVSVITILLALTAAGGSVACFTRESRQRPGNLAPLLTFCAGAIGYAIAGIPGEEKGFNGNAWVTVPGLLGSGIHGRYIFAGVVSIMALIIAILVLALPMVGPGVRAGILSGWLLVTGAIQVGRSLVITEPGYRAAAGFSVEWVFWAIVVALGIVVLVNDRTSRTSGVLAPTAMPTR